WQLPAAIGMTPVPAAWIRGGLLRKESMSSQEGHERVCCTVVSCKPAGTSVRYNRGNRLPKSLLLNEVMPCLGPCGAAFCQFCWGCWRAQPGHELASVNSRLGKRATDLQSKSIHWPTAKSKRAL